MGRFIEMTGKRFGRLEVIERAANRGGSVIWKCRCDCGTIKDIPAKTLRNGTAQSCGCLQKEKVSMANGTHRMRKTRLYGIWHSMKNRCVDTNDIGYHLYGARGIKVCDEWRDSFEAFRDWAMANGYRDDLTIDRNDPDGDYCPENCRWATQKEQQNNRRNNKRLFFNGEEHTMSEWAEITGIKVGTIHSRLKRGWTVEKTLTETVAHEK